METKFERFVGIFVPCVVLGLLASIYFLMSNLRSDVTYYRHGTITASGEAFHKEAFTCAVKKMDDMGSWYRFSYRNRVVYAWANDIIPEKARADYDLSEGAFRMLADPHVGKIRAVVERVK
jgi:hypothetical protein